MPRSAGLRLWATLLLTTFLSGAVVPLFGDLHTGFDVACTDEAWTDAGHHTTTQIEGVRPPVGHDHCAVCHLQRALGGAFDDAKRWVSADGTTTAIRYCEIHRTRDSARRGLPSRAPPARL